MLLLGACYLKASGMGHAGTEGPQTAPMYVGDVLNEMGADHARRTYWDFGTWAMLWRSWRPPDEEPVTFEVCSHAMWPTMQSQLILQK